MADTRNITVKVGDMVDMVKSSNVARRARSWRIFALACTGKYGLTSSRLRTLLP